jgi:uncharacterized membrane protein
MQHFEHQAHQSETTYQAQPLYETSSTTTEENPQQNEQQHYYRSGYQEGYAAGLNNQQQVPNPGVPPVHGPSLSYVPPAMFYAGIGNSQPFDPDIASRLVASIAYMGGWFTGLLVLLFAGNNRYLRFHGLQSLIFFGGANVLFMAGIAIAHFSWLLPWFTHGLLALGFMVLLAVITIGWFVGVIGALCGRSIKLPFVGDMAEQGSSNGGIQSHVK